MVDKPRAKSAIINGLIIVAVVVFCLAALFTVLSLELAKGNKQINHGRDAKRLSREWVPTGGKQGRPNKNASSPPGFPDSIQGYNQVAQDIETNTASCTYIPIDNTSVVDSMTASIQQYNVDTEAAEAVYQLRNSYMYDYRLIWMRMHGTMVFFGDDHASYAVIAWSEGNQMFKILAKVKSGKLVVSLQGPLMDVASNF